MSFGGGKHQPLGGLFGKESQSGDYSVYLNVTPLMDVMSNILFFLLASFGATIVAIVPTTVPVRSAAAPETPAEEEDKVDVSVKLDLNGMTVSAQSARIDPATLKDLQVSLPKSGEVYDHAGLTAALKRIKDRYPASKTLVLVPDDGLKYEVVVGVMDAARDWRAPTGHRIELFPEVVLSGLNK